MATIDPQIAARHEAAGIADQEHGGSTVFLRRAQLAQHILRWPISSALRILLEKRLDHRSHDIAG